MPASKHPSGLGRGLGELFMRTDEEDADTVSHASQPIGDGSWFAELPVSQITPNHEQPRTAFDEDALDELAQSVKDVGLLQPIVVRQTGPDAYELVMGERRWRAHQLAGLATIPSIVRATDNADMLRDALLENLHRVQLNPLEEAAAYQQMMDDFGLTQDELSDKVRKSRPHISNTIRLLRLPSAVQRRVAAGVLSAGHARAILALDSPDAQEKLAARIVAEGLSVRATEEAVALDGSRAERVRPKRDALPDQDDATREAEAALTERLDTRVHVRLGRTHGTITVDYADADDLSRIVVAIVGGPLPA